MRGGGSEEDLVECVSALLDPDQPEVQVDGGEWTRAELGGVPSVDTWVQWAVTIDVPEGDHEVRVRATGKDGETQTSVVRSPDPDGATGWHAVEFSAG